MAAPLPSALALQIDARLSFLTQQLRDLETRYTADRADLMSEQQQLQTARAALTPAVEQAITALVSVDVVKVRAV